VSEPLLLVDYGEVISRRQPQESVAAMARTAGLSLPVFIERYWEYRPDYDRGGSARTFWSAVRGSEVTEDRLLEELVRQDVMSWSHLNPETLDVLRQVKQQGASLSLLSNAPHELATAISDQPAFEIFDQLFFSARLGVAKPDPAAFSAALEKLSRPAGDVLFVDDRPENVEAAATAGFRALRFTSAVQLRSELLQ
jgi:putative hydrolase of the HAD superfamily